jgi:hypothetical protein
MAVPEKMDGFLVTHLAGEFVDVIARVNQLAFLPLDITEPGGVRYDSLKTFRNDCHIEIFVSKTPLSSANYAPLHIDSLPMTLSWVLAGRPFR